MKQVHDIVNFVVEKKILMPGEDPRHATFPVAFIQWGNEEEGYQYEAVCPWCARSIGWIISDGDFNHVKRDLAVAMAEHHRSKQCPRFGASTFDVEKATKPLNTQKLPTVN